MERVEFPIRWSHEKAKTCIPQDSSVSLSSLDNQHQWMSTMFGDKTCSCIHLPLGTSIKKNHAIGVCKLRSIYHEGFSKCQCSFLKLELPKPELAKCHVTLSLWTQVYSKQKILLGLFDLTVNVLRLSRGLRLSLPLRTLLWCDYFSNYSSCLLVKSYVRCTEVQAHGSLKTQCVFGFFRHFWILTRKMYLC